MKLNRRRLRRLIKEEYNNVLREMSMGPDDPAYDAAGEVIMMTTRKFAHLAPMIQQGFAHMFENDIYHYVADMCQDYGCEGHEDYITERVMNMLKSM